jgi:hypothetical protein
MIDRAIIMLNDHRFWGHASGPSSSDCWHNRAARRSALPRERFSPLARNRHADCNARCPLSGQSGKHILAVSLSGFDPRAVLRHTPHLRWSICACSECDCRTNVLLSAGRP